VSGFDPWQCILETAQDRAEVIVNHSFQSLIESHIIMGFQLEQKLITLNDSSLPVVCHMCYDKTAEARS